MCHIFICLIGNAFLFISFLGNIFNTLCVLSLTLILLKDALRLPINKPNLDLTTVTKTRRKKLRQNCLFLFSFEWQKKFAQNSLFISFLLSIYWAQRVVQIRPVRVAKRRPGVLKHIQSDFCLLFKKTAQAKWGQVYKNCSLPSSLETKPNNRPLKRGEGKPTKNDSGFAVVCLSVLLFFIIYIFSLINSSFYYFFTKNILRAESGVDSPRSGCEAATRCTKTYTFFFL